MANQNISNFTQSWNNGATDFNAIKCNVTNLASAAASKLIDLQVGSASKFNVAKNGDMTLTNDDAGAAAGPVITLYRDSASPAASDILGKILFQGEDDAGNTEDYAEIYGTIADATSTSEDGSILMRAKVTGTMTTLATLGASGLVLSTALAIASGGTGATDASGARTALGLEIGTNVQAHAASLDSWAGVTRAAGFDTFAATPSSANLRALLSDEEGTGAAYFVGGALGTPSSATLTNATGLPVSGITSSTSTALGVGSLEVGHASDTTISRGAAGFIAVEGNRVPSPASQASGDLLYRGGTEWERLPKGTAGQVLTMNAGATAPEWQTGTSVPSQTQGTWDTGTDTTESTITAAKLKAAIITHAPAASTTFGAVGTYVFARRTSGSGDIAEGDTLAGSSLSPTSAIQGISISTNSPATGTSNLSTGTALSGTWQAMGTYDHAGSTSTPITAAQGATLWLRIA